MIFQCICGNTSKAIEHNYNKEQPIYEVPRFKPAIVEDDVIGLQCEKCGKFIPFKAKKTTFEEMGRED